jgi:stage V sporulation protein R
MLTKIMNEGWASFWHSRLMTGSLLRDAEVVDYACQHAGAMGGDDGP